MERDRESQSLLGKQKNIITHKTHKKKNWLNIGVFIELVYKAGRAQEWVLILRDTYTHTHTNIRNLPIVCLCLADAFVSG